MLPFLTQYSPENFHKQIIQKSAEAELLLKNVNQTQIDFQIFKTQLKEHKKNLKSYQGVKISRVALLPNKIEGSIKKAIEQYAQKVSELKNKKKELEKMEASNDRKRKQNKRLSLSMSELPTSPPPKSQKFLKNVSEPNLVSTYTQSPAETENVSRNPPGLQRTESSEAKQHTKEKKDDEDDWVHATCENVPEEAPPPPKKTSGVWSIFWR